MTNELRILNDIEWSFSEEFNDEVLNSLKINKIFDFVKKIDLLPIKNGEIYFSDDVWNFSKSTLNRVSKSKKNFNFSTVNEEYKDKVKFFILTSIWEEQSKIQTISKSLAKLRKFLNFIASDHIYSIEYVSLNSIENFVETLNKLEPQTVEDYKAAIKKFFQFYTNNYRGFDWDDIFKFLDNYDDKACQAQRESNKWPNIPDDFFNRLISFMQKVMEDENANIDERGISSEIILLSQTGLRQGALINCTINSITSLGIFNGTETAYRMDYYTTKNTPGDGTKRKVYTYINPLAFKAYSTLDKIYKDRRNSINSDLLFVPTKLTTFPPNENTLNRMLTTFLLKYGDEIGCINVNSKYPELKAQPVGVLIDKKATTKEVLSRYKRTDIVSIPRPHQFRVFVCNELYNQFVPLLFIQLHMTHLSVEMATYYIRPKKDMKKEQDYAESVMRMIVTDETEIIGDSKNALMIKIQDFINKSKLNVAIDLDEIVSALVKKVPIRAKNGGICIKSGPIRDCSKNDLSDELYCAYGMCPNDFHVFFMIDISYEKFATSLKTLKYNSENGFVRAAEKETNKIKWILQNRLIPEMDSLKKEIAKKGADEIKKNQSHISWFVDNLDSIYKEVIPWTI